MKTHLRVQCLENKRPTHRYKMENKITDQEGLKITIDHKLTDKWLKKECLAKFTQMANAHFLVVVSKQIS